MKFINEQEELKFRVMVGSRVLLEAISEAVANQFIATLDAATQKDARIVPITREGKEFLLG
jgi:hypothetical protein